MKKNMSIGFGCLLLSLMVLTLAVCTPAIADSAIPDNGILSVSLDGIETRGVTYTLKEIVRRGDRLDVIFIHQPNEENAVILPAH